MNGRRLLGLCASMAACALLAAGCAWLWRQQKEASLLSQRPRAAALAPSPAPAAPSPSPEPAEPTPAPALDFGPLLQRNGDVVGWISIPGTGIDLPLMQGADNAYYLSHGLDGETDPLGLPFADWECDVQSGRHLIVYGHNLGRGETGRFSCLQNYRDPDYYRAHPLIQLDTLYESTQYQISAVFALTARTEDDDYFALAEHTDFKSYEEERLYLRQVEQRAFYTTGDFIREEEKLLSLCTCTYEMADARLVILARPLRQGESAGPAAVTIHPDPLLPERWPPGA